MIAVIDYGIGNVQSVVNACERHGADAVRVADGAALVALQPQRIILPGVGAIGAALDRLRERGFEAALGELVLMRGVPFLGICVGMQMLATQCTEFGTHHGLGWIDGEVTRLPEIEPPVRLPHVGWNDIQLTAAAGPVLAGLNGADFYFVHSCHFICAPDHVAATAFYGHDFVAAVRKGPITGVQFHPEKSAEAGFRLIGNFLEAGDA